MAGRTIRPSAAAREAKSRATEGIHDLEYSLTYEYRHPQRGSFWVKFGAKIDPREGETADEAKGRLSSFVIESVNEQIAEIDGNAVGKV